MLRVQGRGRQSMIRRLRPDLAAAGMLSIAIAGPALADSQLTRNGTADGVASITRGGITVAVPPRGMGVRASALMVTGARSLQVETTVDGRVLIIEEPGTVALAGSSGQRPIDPSTQMAGSPPACEDDKRKVTGSWWRSTFQWSFKSGSKPSSMSATTAEAALKQAMKNITQSRNDCGLPDEVSASASYLGRTTRGTRIGSSSSCSVTDNHNVVAFGDLSSSTVGFTCWWYQGTRTVEADVQLNKNDFSWVVAGQPCVNSFVVQGVATHEFGHVFGLGHVSQSNHANLTMSTAIYPCDNSDASLGLGDVLGLRAHY